MTEEWKTILWADAFEVSNLGRVRRIATKAVRATWVNSRGYCIVRIRNNDRKFVTWRLHRLVMNVFVGQCPSGQEVNHKNRNKLDNSLENLEYVTPKQNMQHYRECSGDHYGRPRNLTEEQASEVLLLKSQGMKPKAIAQQLGMDPLRIVSTLYAGTWKELKDSTESPVLK